MVFDGQKLQTEFIDEWQLKAVVPPDLLQEGTFPVAVENPNFATVALRAQDTPYLPPLSILDHVSSAYLLFVKP